MFLTFGSRFWLEEQYSGTLASINPLIFGCVQSHTVDISEVAGVIRYNIHMIFRAICYSIFLFSSFARWRDIACGVFSTFTFIRVSSVLSFRGRPTFLFVAGGVNVASSIFLGLPIFRLVVSSLFRFLFAIFLVLLICITFLFPWSSSIPFILLFKF